MADKKVSELVEATSAALADVFLIVQGGLSKKISKTNLFKDLESLSVTGQVSQWKTHETLMNSGAVSVTSHTTFLNNGSVGSTLAFTLAAGTEGMTKVIACASNVGTITLTVTAGLGFTTVTFPTSGSALTLHYINGVWVIVGSNNVVIA